jgi:glycine cleavage system transcriptional repressor
MNTNRKEYIISITSRDRVGIIHDVAGAVSYMNGDLADMRQQVLRGYFSMILYVSFPEDVTSEEIQQRLVAVGTEDAAVEVSIKKVRQSEPDNTAADANCYVLTADGEDRIGFVATVTKFCKDNKINILDLTTTVSKDRYTMILFVDLGDCSSMDALRNNLDRFAEATDLNMVLQHNDIFKATNEIKIF